MVNTLPVLALIGIMAAQGIWLGDTRPYFALFTAIALSLCIGALRGKSWKEMSRETFRSAASVLPSAAIFLIAGMLVSTWIASGTMPAVIIFGLRHMAPSTFLLWAFLLCFAAGMLMGTGIPAVSTAGVVMAGIGNVLGVPLWLTAGAVGTGAFSSNAVSPLSQAINATPAAVGSDLDEHTRGSWRTMAVPVALSAALYLAIGFLMPLNPLPHSDLIAELEASFPQSGLVSLLPPLLATVLVLRKNPALPSFCASILLAVLIALLSGTVSLAGIPSLITDGFRYKGQNAVLTGMLNRGGMLSLLPTILTMLLGISLGGSLQAAGLLEGMIDGVVRRFGSPRSLRAAAVFSTLFITAVGGVAAVAYILIGSLLGGKCEKSGLSRLDLSVPISCSAPGMSAVFPWTLAGAHIISTMHLPVGAGDFSGLLFIPCSFTSWLTLFWVLAMPLMKRPARSAP